MTAPNQADTQPPVYVQLTEPARTFFVANLEARQLVADFTNSLHYLDNMRNLLILTLIAFDPADHQQYIDDHRDELRAHLMATSNFSAEEADQRLENPVTFSQLILQDSKNARKCSDATYRGCCASC